MRKAELIKVVADKTGIAKVDVIIIVETMLQEIKRNVANGKKVHLKGFGSFFAKKRAAKFGRNINKNTLLEIPEHYISAFNPSKDFKLEVKTKREPE